jgi:TM2 domain-containing membrane protein YozV
MMMQYRAKPMPDSFDELRHLRRSGNAEASSSNQDTLDNEFLSKRHLELIEDRPPYFKGADEKYCFECGCVILAKAEICPKCGVRQLAGVPGRGSIRIAAGLFAIFLGALGIHKFYLGDAKQGTLYLLLTVFSLGIVGIVLAIVSLIEGISYLSLSDEEFTRRYN